MLNPILSVTVSVAPAPEIVTLSCNQNGFDGSVRNDTCLDSTNGPVLGRTAEPVPIPGSSCGAVGFGPVVDWPE